MTQSIIVYRNPLEAAIYESPYLLPVMTGIGVGLISFLIVHSIAEKLLRRVNSISWRDRDNYALWISAPAGIAACVAMVKFMLI
jgi:hypothetical protein